MSKTSRYLANLTINDESILTLRGSCQDQVTARALAALGHSASGAKCHIFDTETRKIIQVHCQRSTLE